MSERAVTARWKGRLVAGRTPSRGLLIVFCVPGIMQGFMHAPALALIQGVYAKHTGLTLAALGTALLISRIFDAVTDPLIGLASDSWYRRRGTRKPFVLLGTLFSVTGIWFLFRPPHDVTVVYFGTWFMVTYLGWTITEIPFRAWSFELSSDYVVRTRIQTMMSIALFIGGYAFYFVPFLTRGLGLTDSTEINLDTLSFAAIGVVALMPLSNLITVLLVPDGAFNVRQSETSLGLIYNAVRGNTPLIYFIAMLLLYVLGNGLSQGTSYLFIDSFLGLARHLSTILLFGTPVLILALPLWGWLCQRFERRQVWAWAAMANGVVVTAFGFVPVGEDSLPLVFLAYLSALFFSSCFFVVAPAMLGDIVDFGRWRFGADYGGTYSALYTLITKVVTGIGLALSLLLLNWFGYDATAAEQTRAGGLAMRTIGAWLPGLTLFVTAILVWRFPISRGRHRQIVRDLEERDGTES